MLMLMTITIFMDIFDGLETDILQQGLLFEVHMSPLFEIECWSICFSSTFWYKIILWWENGYEVTKRKNETSPRMAVIRNLG